LSRCRRFVQILPILLASFGTLVWSPSLRAQAPVASRDPKGVVAQARAAYYNLSSRGYRQYRFQARPDWAAMLGNQAKTNPAGYDAAMALFSKVRFDVVVDANGNAKITHNDVDAPNDQTRAGLTQVYGGMDQMLTGFFQTWTPFMIETPFTNVGTDLSVETVGANYRVRWVESGTTKVEILTDQAFAVTEMKVNSPTFDSIIRPVFDRGPSGLVLASYEAEYKEKAPASPIRIVVLIKNRSIQSLLMPSDLDLTAWVGDNKTHILMAFTDASLDKK
jgi:hypothetical protein